MRFRSPRALLARWLALHERRRSMSFLLRRADDRLITDIGLTREELRRLLETPRVPGPDTDPQNENGATARPPPFRVPGIRPRRPTPGR